MLGNGCADNQACNYDENAIIEDGSCCYENCGCTAPLVENCDPSATCEDQSCAFMINGFVFNDEDENGTFDNQDFAIPFQTVRVEPG
ncbi:MAG: hypothetical protein HRT74_05970 [Flavobacteriales bacterium]|nr:hypothetical protein [Flavobacteriales bacterium]